MTDVEKNALVKAMTDEADDSVISAFLSMAAEAICHYCDPYGTIEATDILEKYGSAQAKLAAYFLNKRGADGQTAHSENGISRTYESGDIPPSIMREITPICGSVKAVSS